MPRLTYIDALGGVVCKEFTDVDVRTNDWAHLVLTHTGTELKCYLNGVLKQTITGVTAFHSNMAKTPLCVGGAVFAPQATATAK